MRATCTRFRKKQTKILGHLIERIDQWACTVAANDDVDDGEIDDAGAASFDACFPPFAGATPLHDGVAGRGRYGVMASTVMQPEWRSQMTDPGMRGTPLEVQRPAAHGAALERPLTLTAHCGQKA